MSKKTRFQVGQHVKFETRKYGEAWFKITGVREGPDGLLYEVFVVESSHSSFPEGSNEIIPVVNQNLKNRPYDPTREK